MKKTFEERYPEILYEINKRENKWDLNCLEFEDARQIILTKIFQKYHLFDEDKVINGKPVEFSHWVQRVITRAIYSLWRDHLAVYSRPCLGNPKYGMERCAFNTGGDLCSKTASGKQCSECPLYKEWEKSKKNQHDIKQPLALDNHTQEVSNIQSDFMDIADKKRVIDEKMKTRLDPEEWKVYELLMIKGGTEKEAAIMLGFKERKVGKTGKKTMFPGYASVLKLRHQFVDMAKEIIESEDLA